MKNEFEVYSKTRNPQIGELESSWDTLDQAKAFAGRNTDCQSRGYFIHKVTKEVVADEGPAIKPLDELGDLSSQGTGLDQ